MFSQMECRLSVPGDGWRSVDELENLPPMKTSIFDLLLATVSAAFAFALWTLFPEVADTAVTVGLWALLTAMSFVRRKRILIHFCTATGLAFVVRFGTHLDMVTSPYFLAEFIDLSLLLFCFGVVTQSAMLSSHSAVRYWAIAALFVPLFLVPFWFPILPLIPLSIMAAISFALVLTWRRESTASETTEPSRSG